MLNLVNALIEKFYNPSTKTLGFKGVDKNMSCRPKTFAAVEYELDKKVTFEGDLILCKKGLHFCKELEHVFSYYTYKEIISTTAKGGSQLKKYGHNRFFVIRHGSNYIKGENGDEDKYVTDEITLLEEIKIDTLENIVYLFEASEYKELYTKNRVAIFLMICAQGNMELIKYVNENYMSLEMCKSARKSLYKYDLRTHNLLYKFLLCDLQVIKYIIESYNISLYNTSTDPSSGDQSLFRFNSYIRKDYILRYHVHFNNLETIKYFVSLGLSIEDFRDAINFNFQRYESKGSLRVFKYFVSIGLTLEDIRESDILVANCYIGNLEIVEYLISLGLTLKDIRRKRNGLCTALYYAILNGQLEVVKCLMSHGLNNDDIRENTY